MIPKRIHYCWFGKGKQNKLVKQCIKSWKKYCPDYEIIEWNENNCDIASLPLYARQAYETKHWAFLTDYLRLKVVYDNGGIYFDTDVEVIHNIDELLDCQGFFGFEDSTCIATGLGFGAVKGLHLLSELMKDYEHIPFIKEDCSFDLTICLKRNLPTFQQFGIISNGMLQKINGVYFYPSDVFCPKNYETGELKLTEATKTIHHYNGSWLSKRRRFLMKKEAAFIKKYGQKEGKALFARWQKKYHFIILITMVSPWELMQKIKKMYRQKVR